MYLHCCKCQNFIASMTQYYSMCIFIHSSSYSSVEEHRLCPHLTYYKHSYKHWGARIFQISAFVFFGFIPNSGIPGSHGPSVFSFLRNLYTVFHRVCASLFSHQKCILRFPFLLVFIKTCYF